MSLSAADIQPQLSRRRPGQSHLTTPRNEKDAVHIQSGVEHNITLGTPIGMLVKNEDQRPYDYGETDLYPRPSHADWTYLEKYGVKASSGGGRSSARETIGESNTQALGDRLIDRKQVGEDRILMSCPPLVIRTSRSWSHCREVPLPGSWN